MTTALLIGAIVLIAAVGASRALYRFGVPALLVFLVLGMLFGSDGLVGIAFDDYDLAREISTIGLIVIMFYGGFGTNWTTARPVAGRAILMSSLGVFLTAGLTGIFCSLLLHMSLAEGLLVGSIVASTDAASVFAILRSRKLNLKGGLAPLLEIESGSNDPFAYMLTLVMLSVLLPGQAVSVPLLLGKQLVLGVGFGFLLGAMAAWLLGRIKLEGEGLYPILTTGVALLSFALSERLGGNGFLSVYLTGIVLGNSRILHKKSQVHFFDGLSWLMQILLFFTLGLLSFPSSIPKIILPGILLSVFLIFVARPIATVSILSWFRVPWRQQLLVAFGGLRGAASIVFAIYAVSAGAIAEHDIFHLVFFVALFSVAFLGSLLPWVAKRLDLVDREPGGSVLRTFTDFEDYDAIFYELPIGPHHPWAGESIMEARIPEELLAVMVRRKGKAIVPHGSTVILPDDVLVLAGDMALLPEDVLLSGDVRRLTGELTVSPEAKGTIHEEMDVRR